MWRVEPRLELVCWQNLNADTLWCPALELSVPEGLHLMERTHTGAVCEELQPVGRTHREEVHGGLSSEGVTSHWGRDGVRNPPCEEEGVTECDELTTFPVHCSWEGAGEIRSYTNPVKKREVWGKGFSRLGFISHCHSLI